MATDFPNSPANGATHTFGGTTYTYSTSVGAWTAGSSAGGASVTVSETAPATPSNGDTWYDDNANIYYVRINNAWKSWLGTVPVYASTFTKGQVIDHEDLENASGFTSFHSQSQFNNDGTKWFVATLDTNQYDVLFEEWDLSTAYDLSTATYSQSVFRDILVEQGGVRAMTFNDDGTELLIWCRTPAGNDPRARAYTFTLSTAYDISTLSGVPSTYVSTAGAGVFDGSAGGNGRSYTWTPDGSVLYASEHTSRVCKVEVGTSFDLTDITTSEQLESDDLGITETGTYVSIPAYGVGFRNNGRLCYILQGSTDSILHETLLSTPYDITTGTLLASINLGDFPYSFETTQNILMAPDSIIIYGSLGTNNGGYKYTYVNVTDNSSVNVNWAGSRGMGVGGSDGSLLNTLQYFDLSTTGNATDFGDLTEAISKSTASSSGSRGVRIAGQVTADPFYTNTIDYWTFATTGNATDFGDATGNHARRHATVGNGTRAISSGGVVYVNIIEYITIATTGNAQDFGDLITGLLDHFSTNDDTRGIFAGGNNQFDQTRKEMMDYITMATTGNSTDFGDLNTPTVSSGVGIVSDNTTGLFMGGGNTYSNQILKVTIATTGNSSDFGDLTASKAYLGQTSYPTNARGVAMSGYLNPGSVRYNVIEYVTISTPGNAQDFGDLLSSSERVAGTSGNAA